MELQEDTQKQLNQVGANTTKSGIGYGAWPF